MPPSVTTATSSPASRRSIELDGAIVLVPLEHRDERLADVEASQQAAGAPRVLRRDERDRRQGLARPVREISEVADRRADEEEDAAHAVDGPTFASAYHGPDGPAPQGLLRHPAAEEARDPRGGAGLRRRRARGLRRRPRSPADGRPAPRARRLRMDVVLLFVTQERDLASRFAKLAAGARARRTALGRLAEEGVRAPDRPRLRHRAADRPRRGARGQQERVGDRGVPGPAVRLPPEGPAALRAAGRVALDTLTRVAHRVESPFLQRLNRPWVAVLAVTAIAAVVRLWGLSSPPTLVFDENYYAKAACIFVGGTDHLCKIDSHERAPVPRAGVGRGLVRPPAARQVDDRARDQGVRDEAVRLADRLRDRGHAGGDGRRADRPAALRATRSGPSSPDC